MSMSLSQLIVYLMVAAICGYVGQALVRRKMPGGLAGAIIAALVGAYLMVAVLHINIAPELSIEGIPIISAVLGAAIVVFVLSLISPGRRR